MCELKQRLNDYKKILNVYQNNLGNDDILDHGICYVFYNILNIDIYNNIKEMYPELYAQKPHKLYDIVFEYWWKPGLKEPRIEVLKNAIDLCEKKLK
jgi:hypothetical protein